MSIFTTLIAVRVLEGPIFSGRCAKCGHELERQHALPKQPYSPMDAAPANEHAAKGPAQSARIPAAREPLFVFPESHMGRMLLRHPRTPAATAVHP